MRALPRGWAAVLPTCHWTFKNQPMQISGAKKNKNPDKKKFKPPNTSEINA